MNYTKQDAIDSVREAAEQLCHSPSASEYQELGLSPSTSTIRKHFGGWDSIKEEADLTLISNGSHSKYEANVNYFDTIDSSEKAYWLGMLFGDGWVSNTKTSTIVGLGLSEEAHVKRFREALDSTHPIDHSGVYRLRIGQEGLAQGLAQHGFDEHKTNSDALPNLIENYRPHFVRGLSDADGSFAEKTDCSTFTWSLAGGSKSRFEQIIEWLPVETKVCSKGDGSYSINVTHRDDLSLLIDWMYPEGEETKPALPRKLALAQLAERR